MLVELLERIESFQPADDNWRDLDTHLQALANHDADLFTALPTLFRIFERYPRHDGHGVFWSVLHLIEGIRGYEALLVDHVTRAPTDMGITMLQRLVSSGIVRVGLVELEPLIAKLTPRAPVIDYTIDHPKPRARPALGLLVSALEGFVPTPPGEIDWSPLLVLVAQLLETNDHAIVTPLLRTLDRFHSYDGFAPFWPIVNGVEQLTGFPSALVASMQQTPTRYGLTLLLRLLAREVYSVDGVDVAALAAEHMTRAE